MLQSVVFRLSISKFAKWTTRRRKREESGRDWSTRWMNRLTGQDVTRQTQPTPKKRPTQSGQTEDDNAGNLEGTDQPAGWTGWPDRMWPGNPGRLQRRDQRHVKTFRFATTRDTPARRYKLIVFWCVCLCFHFGDKMFVLGGGIVTASRIYM